MKIHDEYLNNILYPEEVSKHSESISAPTKHVLGNEIGKSYLSRFDFLYTTQGYHNTKKWFLINTTNADNSLNEPQFLDMFRKLTDLPDFKIIEVFEIFDHEESGRITFLEFFLLLSLLAAKDNSQYTQFLHRHGNLLFELFQDPFTEKANVMILSKISNFVGIPEQKMYSILKEMALDSSSTVDQQDFILYLFVLFDQLDKETKEKESETRNKQNFQRISNSKETTANEYFHETLASLPRVSTVTPGFTLCKPFFSSSDKSRGFQ